MFDPIRELIAENKIAQALAACGGLELTPTNRSRLIALRRRWDQLVDKDIAQASEQRLLTLEGNGIVDDLLKWLDQMEYSPEVKEEWPVKGTRAKQDEGAAAGAQQESVKSNAKWLWVAAAIVALLAVTWGVWPDQDDAATQARVEDTRDARQNPEVSVPPVKEEPTPAVREEAPTTPTNPGKTKLNPSDLVVTTPGKVDLSKVDASKVQLNPGVRLDNETLKKLIAASALMTTGKQVDIAVALYRNTKAPTEYDAVLSRALASYLMREARGMDIIPEVLTQKFHDHEKRDRLQMRGTFDASGLNAGRARFLFLCDVRNIDARGKAEFRMCLYDVERGKGFTRGKSIDVGTSARMNPSTGSRLQEKELFYAARDYLKEMKEREILK